uniref:Uncharacterized protein n=1 Tax=Rhizophora mucronata TaxID=61149 RepID=A0A2P2QGT6_RHIMU
MNLRLTWSKGNIQHTHFQNTCLSS